MIRPRHIWIVFALCLVVVLAAMGWISAQALRLERAEAETRRRAALEEDVRLALWRMDSALAPLIARESARPYFMYSAFYPAERAYTRMYAEIEQGEVLVPSPLLAPRFPHVQLFFQFGPDGELTSPQVPTGNMRDLAETGYVTPEEIGEATKRLAELQALVSRETLLAALREAPATSLAALTVIEPRENAAQQPQSEQQSFFNVNEYQARTRSNRQAANQEPGLANAPLSSSPGLSEGPLGAVWLNGALLLARRVSVGGQEYVQGCRLDWAGLRAALLAQVADLLPGAALEPATSHGEEGRTLAALPVRIVPAKEPDVAAALSSPIRLSLVIAWGCVLLGAAAVAALVAGVVSLSERRGAFVSAVTHELRTPLTTFRIYTELLAAGAAQDEAKRRRYLDTLQGEADRLSHLVENVLAYARLTGASARGGTEIVPVREMLDRFRERLEERASRAGMQLVVEGDEEALAAAVRASASAVEQILLNLVDNASKYAASASDRRIHLEVGRAGGFVALRVRDHGPGVGQKDAKRLFRAFSKSATEAANTAVGVGLGLALSRRLARSMGGDLQLDKGTRDGACFVLTVPSA
jgi:signal transduction histidine kinase